jgi:diguanylate cyclase (GGDEF)-like protein
VGTPRKLFPGAAAIGAPPSRAVRIEMAQALAALFGAGGTLTLLSLLFPTWPGLRAGGVAVPAVAAEVVCVALLWWGSRVPESAFQVFLILGTGCICMAVYFGGGAGRAVYGSYYVWVALYAFYFFPGRAAWRQLLIAALGYLAVLAARPEVAAGPTWLVVMGTASVTGVVTQSLVLRIRELARDDPLTGVLNRRGWEEALGRELPRSMRSGAPVCVALVDLDGLKTINDTQGHDAGDEVLQEMVKTLRAVLRPGDALGRLGGDEFAVLLPGCDAQMSEGVLARMVLGDQNTFSAGVATWDRAESARDLVSRADRAMYVGKQAGGARIQVG